MKMTFRIVFWGAVAVFLGVVTVVVFVPGLTYRPHTTVVAEKRQTPEVRGRELFYRNGCNYCHTMYVRGVDNGMGAVSAGGNYNFDNPMTLGSERTGPDLSYIGRKRSVQWEIDHAKYPRLYSPMSLMPNWFFLPDRDLRDIMLFLFGLGDRNAAEWMVAPQNNGSAAWTYSLLQPPGQPSESTPSAGANPAPQGWPTFIQSGLYDGKLLYVKRCLTCHGCAGNGLGHYAGTLIVTPANFKADPFRDMPDDQWFWHVSEGVQGSVMPPWKESLSVEARWKIIRYVQTVYAHSWERDPDEGDLPKPYQLNNPLPKTLEVLDEGKRIWTRECMVCHGDAATGEGPYRQGIEPVPPDFSAQADYADFTDGDYFWRISEGVPWTAMPTWKEQYTENERWALVHYIREIFIQNESKPATPPVSQEFDFPANYKTLSMPKSANVSYQRGKQQFLQMCAHCHGEAGDGSGPNGQYLNPKPFDFRQLAGKPMTQKMQAELFARISFGVKDTAMPAWGEWLRVDERWNDVAFIMQSFMQGKGVNKSVFGNGAVPDEYVRTDVGIYTDELGNAPDPKNGKKLYDTHCANCHGPKGAGDGPGTKGNASGAPAAFPKGTLTPQYVFWRVRAGVNQSVMPGYTDVYAGSDFIDERAAWDITAYVLQLGGVKLGG